MPLAAHRVPPLDSFGPIFEPQEAVEPILGRDMRQLFLAWLTEIWAEKDLEEVGIQPRRKAVFDGPPGTGKTTLAHHLAARLGMPMLSVRPEKINSQYVSESARLVGGLFDSLEAVGDPYVVFFDEFDSIGRARMTSGRNELGEQDHNLMVNTLLARIERYDGIVIAATNHGKQLDQALWRRFDLHVELPVPAAPERQRILARYFEPFVLTDHELKLLAEAFETASPALMRAFAENIKRNVVVGPKARWDMSKRATLLRVLDSVKPHPDLGMPRLWSLREKDAGFQALNWPLSREKRAEPKPDKKASEQVVAFPGRAG